MKTVRILNAEILSINQDELLKQFKKGVLLTPNLDHLIKLQTDKDFYEIYQRADWIICDSRILYFASKIRKNSIVEAIPGSSFFTAFYKYHKSDSNCKIFLLGAAEGVAKKAMEKINNEIGRNIVVGAYSPSFGFEKEVDECNLLVKIINDSGANVLLVGVGAPKQEKWIFKYKDLMPNVDIFMPLGATIDFEAGELQRAPAFLQNIGMEWLFRFFKEPKRLFKRYFINDVKFFFLFGKQLFGFYKNPF